MNVMMSSYINNLMFSLTSPAMGKVSVLVGSIREAWDQGKTIYFCGNGGSAANAMHLANDFIYGAGKSRGLGIRVEALSSNSAVITCLANDIGYENIFAEQLRVKANPGDVLVVLSGSGNSPNIVKALEMGNSKDMKTFAILGYSGGKCLELAHYPIHFEIDDMQIAEDLQLIIGHMCMQELCKA